MVRQVARRAPSPVVRQGRRVASLLPGGDRLRTPPLLSIVLPVYNVEAYLAECLDSILAQDLTSFEVIVVDDGSPDGSTAIARGTPGATPASGCTPANGGLGAARNAGLLRATGRYLMFVDSDDRLPAGALSALVGSCEASGSDVAVGSVLRFNSTRTWTPEWISAVHATDQVGITLKDFPALLRNNYSWCKVFRRTFWEECGLRFREGVAYEDQPIITQLYLRATGIDVLSQPVYEYRARDDASSISQQTGTAKDLRDRAAAWTVSRDALLAEAPTEVYQAWLQTLFSTHFHWYLNNASALVDDEYWEVLREALVDLGRDVPAEVWRRTAPHHRATIELARRGLREDFVEFRRQRGDRAERFPATVREDGVLLHLPGQGPDGPGLDDDVFMLWPEQFTARHQVRRVRWVPGPVDGPPRLRLDGHAHIPHLDLRAHATTVVVSLHHPASGRRVEVPATAVQDAALYPAGNAESADYAGSAFTVELPTDQLLESPAGEKWTVELRVETAGFVVELPVTEIAGLGSAALLEADVDPKGRRFVLDHRSKQPLRVSLDKPKPIVTSARLIGRTLTGVVRPVPGRPLTGVHVLLPDTDDQQAAGTVGELTEDGTQTFELVLPPLPVPPKEEPSPRPVQKRWALRGDARGKAVPLSISTPTDFLDVQPGRGHRRCAGADPARQPRGDRVGGRRRARSLRHRGRRAPGAQRRLHRPAHRAHAARGGHARATRPVTAERQGAEFTARVPLRAERGRFGELPLQPGKYWLEAGVEEGTRTAVIVHRSLAHTFPMAFEEERLAGGLTRTAWGRVQLSLLTPRGEDVRSRAARSPSRRPRRPCCRSAPRGCCWGPTSGSRPPTTGWAWCASCSARGVDMPIRWAVRDFSVPVPDGVEPVVTAAASGTACCAPPATTWTTCTSRSSTRSPPGRCSCRPSTAIRSS